MLPISHLLNDFSRVIANHSQKIHIQWFFFQIFFGRAEWFLMNPSHVMISRFVSIPLSWHMQRLKMYFEKLDSHFSYQCLPVRKKQFSFFNFMLFFSFIESKNKIFQFYCWMTRAELLPTSRSIQTHFFFSTFDWNRNKNYLFSIYFRCPMGLLSMHMFMFIFVRQADASDQKVNGIYVWLWIMIRVWSGRIIERIFVRSNREKN